MFRFGGDGVRIGRVFCLDVFMENQTSMQKWERQQCNLQHEGKPEYQEMLEVLTYAMENELTQRQIECVKMYYFEKMEMKEIARQLDIDISSVSRHLKRARKRLGVVMRYAFRRLEAMDEEV